MIITLRRHGDAPLLPETPPPALVGEATVGPLGLLRVLETRLNLRMPEADPLDRIMRYGAALRRCDDGNRFYSRSLAVDPQGTGKLLLGWRDQLIAGGWDGMADDKAPARLQALAAVEQQLRAGSEPLPRGEADRLQSVKRALPAKTGIAELVLALEPDTLPAPWPAVISLLEKSGVKLTRIRPIFPPAADNDLQRLRDVLDGKTKQAVATGDGSIILLQARAETEAAEGLARLLAQAPSEWLIIDQGDDDSLDRALRHQGLPGYSDGNSSPWRAALQVLPLAFALRWEPLDPARLLDFLLLPRSPIRRSAASRLARAVAEHPGIGGRHWQQALAEAEESIRRRFDKDWQEQIDTLHERVDEWLTASRFAADAGMPVATAMEIAGRLSSWALGIAQLCEEPLFLVTAGKAAQLNDLLARRSGTTIGRIELDGLIDEVIGSGAARDSICAQAGHIRCTREPGMLLQPAPRLLWWDCTGRHEPVLPHLPWNAAERQWLADAQIALPERRLQAAVSAEEMLLPLRLTEQQLVLVVPERVRGELVAPHPVGDIVAAAFGDSVTALERPLAEFVRSGGVAMPAVPLMPLPAPQRWWRLGSGAGLGSRQRESFSGLERFIHRPHEWVLQYAAKLRPGAMLSVPKMRRLQGTLAHLLVGEVLADAQLVASGDEAAVSDFIRQRLPDLLAEEGALLLLPGHDHERAELARFTTRAAWRLICIIRQGNWRCRGTEVPVSGPFAGNELAGAADLVLERDGRRAVLDMKWGGRNRVQELLRDGRAMQLAIYAQLLRGGGAMPDVGYLAFGTGEVLAPRGGPLADALAVDCAADMAETWQRLLVSWQWRRDQLDRGEIEVPKPDVVAPDAGVPPDDGLPLEESRYASPYDTLTGWREEQ